MGQVAIAAFMYEDPAESTTVKISCSNWSDSEKKKRNQIELTKEESNGTIIFPPNTDDELELLEKVSLDQRCNQ